VFVQPIVEIVEYPDYEAYRAFNTFVSKRRPMAWFNWVVVYGMGPVLSLLMLLVIFHSGMVNAFTVGYPLVSVLLIALLATAPRRMFKKVHGNGSTVTNTAFFEDYFAYVSTGENSTRNGSFRYENVVKAYETATAFYLQHGTKIEWYFLPKKFFAPGQVEILRELFVRKFGDNFKSKI